MAFALDKHVLSDPVVSAHVDMSLDFVGFFNDWSTTNITACQTSSRWTECIVNTYHLCARAEAPATPELNWWTYSKCMYGFQYTDSEPWGLECAGMNPKPNQTCDADEYPNIVAAYSSHCAALAGISQDEITRCVGDGQGVELLKESFNKTVTFPRNPHGYTEPQWIQVNGPDCAATGWDGCGTSFDNTSCTDWDACDSNAWALHIRDLVCEHSGDPRCTSSSDTAADVHTAAAAAAAGITN